MRDISRSGGIAAMLVSAALWCSVANATPIEGGISFSGGVTSDTSDISLATLLQFNSVFAVSCSDDFVSICGNTGSIEDLPLPLASGIDDFWTIGGFSFDLGSITSIDRSTSNVLVITGLGTLSGSGYDDTAGTWLFSANSGQGTFAYSATTTSVPEPSTLGLLGAGLLLLGIRARRKRNAIAWAAV